MASASYELYWREKISAVDTHLHALRKVLVDTRTEYQHMMIVETATFGRALILDGKLQSTTADEALYHEPLVHLPAIAHGAPRRVLILGGGEGATAREVLEWKTVEEVVMVDIDGEVVAACREHLPTMHQGAFTDPRLSLVVGDALAYLAKTDARWDLVISDLSEPVESGPSFRLFTKEHFEDVRRVLAPGGVFALQAGSLTPYEIHLHGRLFRTLEAVFGHVHSYVSHVPSFLTPWGFLMARDEPFDLRPNPDDIDRLLADKVRGPLVMMDGRTTLALMQTPKHVRSAIARETRVYTMDAPPEIPRDGEGG
ncbi:MAG: methyltransferase domain-containing protein [Deltaproteobacteria bacterium]|nr:MAG: methyltransferase domain-containing protein [Deltaproteobacteria bacterium]